MMAVATGWGYGKELSEILGIERITDVKFHFPLEGCVMAQVEFLLNDVQAKALLNLCKDGKWRSPPQLDTSREAIYGDDGR